MRPLSELLLEHGRRKYEVHGEYSLFLPGDIHTSD